MAKDGGTQLKDAANAHVSNLVSTLAEGRMQRLFSLRHDFPVEWHQFETSTDNANFKAIVKKEYFNFLTQGKTIDNVEIEVLKLTESGPEEVGTLNFTDNYSTLESAQVEIELNGTDREEVIFMIVRYSLI
jgi:hypothetical protein